MAWRQALTTFARYFLLFYKHKERDTRVLN